MPLNIPKQISYHTLCSNLLPNHYQSNDSSRLTLGFFTLSSLDLLGVLQDESKFPLSTRRSWIDWIYSCQLQSGGFRGGSCMNLDEKSLDKSGDGDGGDGDKKRNGKGRKRKYDPANIPATFFALESLLILGDDLERVNRMECLDWLGRLQRGDGSFGEVLIEYDEDDDEGGNSRSVIEGGRDLRYCCCAAGIAYILQPAYSSITTTTTQQPTRKQIINEDALVDYIRKCQSYNGGFGESPDREPHSGLTYCGVAALGFVSLLRGGKASEAVDLIDDWEGLVRWIICRQTDVLEEEEEDDSDDYGDGDCDDHDDEEEEEQGGENETEEEEGIPQRQKLEDENFSPSPGQNLTNPIIAGFNGREGKIADTCYCWWNSGALAILDYHHLVDKEAMRLYLLEKVQHMIGGFGKGIGSPPDVMHSYLGLAALAVFGEKGLKPIDPTLCISCDAVANLAKVSWKR